MKILYSCGCERPARDVACDHYCPTAEVLKELCATSKTALFAAPKGEATSRLSRLHHAHLRALTAHYAPGGRWSSGKAA